MDAQLTPKGIDIQEAVRQFLLAILPDGIEVVAAQDNRVPEPAADDFVVINDVRRERVSTNIDENHDCSFTASIAGTTLTVTAILLGTIVPTSSTVLFGTNVTAGTKILSQLTGAPGGIGTYRISTTQTLGSAKFASGTVALIQHTKITYQIDVHGPNAVDNAQTISTGFRDPYAVEFFRSQDPEVAAPLYADDPRQVPFVNENQQVETRWIVEALVQANQRISVAQDFADELSTEFIDVEANYPP
jgi:hypothetical protein